MYSTANPGVLQHSVHSLVPPIARSVNPTAFSTLKSLFADQAIFEEMLKHMRDPRKTNTLFNATQRVPALDGDGDCGGAFHDISVEAAAESEDILVVTQMDRTKLVQIEMDVSAQVSRLDAELKQTQMKFVQFESGGLAVQPSAGDSKELTIGMLDSVVQGGMLRQLIQESIRG